MILSDPIDPTASVTTDRCHGERLYRASCANLTCTRATWLLPDEFKALLKRKAVSRLCHKCFREATVERVNGGKPRDHSFVL